MVAVRERDASCKDLDHGVWHIGQDIYLVVADAEVARDDGHTHYSLDDEGNGTYEDMMAGDRVAEDMVDGYNTSAVLVILRRNLEKGDVDDGQHLKQDGEELDETKDGIHGLNARRLQKSL